jgi:hypothetical protein
VVNEEDFAEAQALEEEGGDEIPPAQGSSVFANSLKTMIMVQSNRIRPLAVPVHAIDGRKGIGLSRTHGQAFKPDGVLNDNRGGRMATVQR